MEEYTSFKTFIESHKNPTVIDYNNLTCKDCNDCCSLFAFITSEEYAKLHRFLREDGKKIYKDGVQLFEEYLNKGTFYCMCLFSDPITKKCKIYDTRPSICRDFHCSSKLNKARINIQDFHLIGELFLRQFLKSYLQVLSKELK
jgi:hypothetical protein